MHHIFLSHTHKDMERAEHIEAALRGFGRRPLQVWRSANLPVGVDWKVEIQRRLHAATAFIPLISESYLASVNATVELGRILEVID